MDCQQLSTIKKSSCYFETDQLNCIYLNKKCLEYAQNQWTFFQRLFPEKFLQEINRKQRTVFVYETEREKPLYIFSNRSNPFMWSRIGLITGNSGQTMWLVKNILNEKKSYRFYGAFNWKMDQIYLLASLKQKSLFIVKLLDSKSFYISTKVNDNVHFIYSISKFYFLSFFPNSIQTIP